MFTEPNLIEKPRGMPYGLLDLGNEIIPRVLVIDDDRTVRRLIRAQLDANCELIEAADASEGITSYNTRQPDIVFMDIELPDGDGRDLLKWIMRNDPGAFVVMLSGHSHTGNVIRSVEMGAKGFIPKPLDISRILHFINLCPKLH